MKIRSLLLGLAFVLSASPAMAAFNLPTYTMAQTGQVVPYWVISQVSLNPITSTINVQVNGYISSTGYVGGLQPITRQSFTISGATYQAFLSSVTAADLPVGTPQGSLVTELIGALQTSMLSLPFFTGATIIP